MSYDVGEVMERSENEQSSAHSPNLPLFHLRHSSFSDPSFASPTSQALHLRHLASVIKSNLCFHDRICFVPVVTSDHHPTGPGFDSRLCPINSLGI